jgi:hypothetical protein
MQLTMSAARLQRPIARTKPWEAFCGEESITARLYHKQQMRWQWRARVD